MYKTYSKTCSFMFSKFEDVIHEVADDSIGDSESLIAAKNHVARVNRDFFLGEKPWLSPLIT